MLRHASADIVTGDHDRPLVPERLEETHQPSRETRNRSLTHGEFTSGSAEAGKIDRYRAKARRGDAVKHGLPDAAPIGSMKQERQGTVLTGGYKDDRNDTRTSAPSLSHTTLSL